MNQEVHQKWAPFSNSLDLPLYFDEVFDNTYLIQQRHLIYILVSNHKQGSQLTNI